MHIAICDDSTFDRRLIVELLQKYFDDRHFYPEISQYENGIPLVSDVQEGAWFDVILLDIYMNELLGIDVARRLRELDYDGEIIFLSATAAFAVDSYDVRATGYLLKPLGFDKLSKVMDQALTHVQEKSYPVRQRARIIRVPLWKISYVESCNSKCILHQEDGRTYVLYKRLNEIQMELGDRRFLRCHQSYLVNMDFVCQVDKAFLLRTGENVLIRQRDLRTIRQIYWDYAAGREA